MLSFKKAKKVARAIIYHAVRDSEVRMRDQGSRKKKGVPICIRPNVPLLHRSCTGLNMPISSCALQLVAAVGVSKENGVMHTGTGAGGGTFWDTTIG